MNLYGFVGNNGVTYLDNIGLIIAAPCPLNEQLDKLGITYSYNKININGVEYHTYSEGNPAYNEEILRLMIRFEHTFMFWGSDSKTCWGKVMAHVNIRKEKAILARKLASAKFGEPNVPDGVDPRKNPEKCTTHCAGILDFLYGVGNTEIVTSSYFIPGDAGYIANTKHQYHGGTEDGVGTEGENIVYLGNKEFFGHHGGEINDKFRSLNMWKKFVDVWGKHDLWDYRETITEGTDGFVINDKFSWEYKADGTSSPYSKGATPGQWLDVKWPTK